MLITLRHPGPADAILTIVPELSKLFYVTMIITDNAIDILKNRFPSYIKKYNIYFPGKYIDEKFSKEIVVEHFKTEFDSNEEEEYEKFYQIVLQLIKIIDPDIALRTTPAYKWGIDEIIPRAMKEIGRHNNSFCYQEYYGVGRGMNNFENKVALYSAKYHFTIDKISVQALRNRGISSINVGWISHLKFKKYQDYNRTRDIIRSQLGIINEKIIMYCVVKCDEIVQEVNHFEKLLKCIEEVSKTKNYVRIIIKFHPRSTNNDIELYRKIINKYRINVDEIDAKIGYNEILTIPDIIYSAASNMNIDLLAYQYANKQYEDIRKHVISVYSYDEFTKKIIYKATGNYIIPSHTKEGGHVIVNDTNMQSVFKKLILDEEKYETVSRIAYDNFNSIHYESNNMISCILKLMR